ncbi:helix-turn-helix transcriptional regulator [Micromonospora sp. BRA006-A]|nr:helix-turn-helix transcriptional regulator [Micromonospora sp. BRA006-A]
MATLAAQGHTNREIAEKLFLTVSAIEQRMTRIYRKLDVNSRSELAGRLRFDRPGTTVLDPLTRGTDPRAAVRPALGRADPGRASARNSRRASRDRRPRRPSRRVRSPPLRVPPGARRESQCGTIKLYARHLPLTGVSPSPGRSAPTPHPESRNP